MNPSPKRSKRKVILFSILLLILGLACVILYYVYNPKKAVTFVFPDLNKISNVNAVIKNDSAFIGISLVLENTNPYKIDIDTIVYELKLADTSIARQTMPLNIKQRWFDEDTVMLPLDLKITQMMPLIRSLQKQDSTTLEINGYIVYQTIFGRYKVDIDKKLTIETPVPPQIKVLKVERESYSLKDKILKINASVELINKGKRIDLELSDIHYNMTVENTLHTNGVYSKTVIVKPQSSIVLNIPMEIEVLHPLKTIVSIISDNDTYNYKLYLTAKVKENVSDKHLITPAEITATGKLELKK